MQPKTLIIFIFVIVLIGIIAIALLPSVIQIDTRIYNQRLKRYKQYKLDFCIPNNLENDECLAVFAGG